LVEPLTALFRQLKAIAWIEKILAEAVRRFAAGRALIGQNWRQFVEFDGFLTRVSVGVRREEDRENYRARVLVGKTDVIVIFRLTIIVHPVFIARVSGTR
jgi:hypothetical protein